MLALVEHLVLVDRRDRPAGAVHRPADLQQPVGLIPVDQFRAGDAHPRPSGHLLQQPLQRVGLGCGVGMQQPQPVDGAGPLLVQRHAHHGLAVGPVDLDDRVTTEPGLDPPVAAVHRPEVDDHDVIDRPRLAGQAPEGLAQERPAVVVDHHGQHSRLRRRGRPPGERPVPGQAAAGRWCRGGLQAEAAAQRPSRRRREQQDPRGGRQHGELQPLQLLQLGQPLLQIPGPMRRRDRPGSQPEQATR